MTQLISFVPIDFNDWDRGLFRGSEHAVNEFMQDVDIRLNSGWVRDEAYEKKQFRFSQIRCYLHDEPGSIALQIWLERATATRVRGGPIQLLRRTGQDDTRPVTELVADFAQHFVLPAADQARVCFSWPKFGPRSAVTFSAEKIFADFADEADGQWPIEKELQKSWEKLVLGCLAEEVGFAQTELLQWVVASGWSAEVAPALVERFFEDSGWFAERLSLLTS